MVKLVVSDMDGTLLDREARLIPEVLDMVRELRRRDICFTIATGRVLSKAERYIRQMDLRDIPYIACNGATVIRNGKPLVNNLIPVAGLRSLLTRARQMKMSIIYAVDGVEYTFEMTPWVRHDQEKSGYFYKERPFSEEEWSRLWVDKFTVMDDVRDGRISEIEAMANDLSGQYFFTRYLDRAIEIVDKDSTKGSALMRVAGLMGVTMDEVLAVGDHQNDMEMIQIAGTGAAVSNATESLKTVADYVCANPNGLGVVEAVERYVFRRNEGIL